MPAVVRDGDPLSTGHGCTGSTTLGGDNQDGTVHANNIDIAVVGAPTVVHTIPAGVCVPHTANLNAGSPNVFVNSIPVGRISDSADAGAMTGGSPNVFINDATAFAAALALVFESIGWESTVLSLTQLAGVQQAVDEEAAFIGTEPDVVTNENGEYGDGYFGAASPRGDANFQGNESPVTGEEGVIETPEESVSEYPEAESEWLNFLPHTDPRIDPVFRAKLETVAQNLGTTLVITSAYRDPAYNARVGGKKGSKHQQGIACDVVMTSFNTQGRIDFIQECIDQGILGIGLYNSFTHVDTGGKRAWGPTGSRTSLPQQSWAIATLQANGYPV